VLLESGSNPDDATKDNGTTPLFLASQDGLVDIATLLLEYGVRLSGFCVSAFLRFVGLTSLFVLLRISNNSGSTSLPRMKLG
jgi:ankyrin repeat protein